MKPVLFALLLLPFHAFAEVNGDIAGHLDGARRFCLDEQDTQGAATAYRLANPEMSLHNGVLTIETQFSFLRCGYLGNRIQWKTQDIFAPIRYTMPDLGGEHQVIVSYSLPEILLVSRSNVLLNATPVRGAPFSETIRLSARLSDILTTAQKRKLERTGEVDFMVDEFLRLRTSYSADGEAPVEMGENAWGGFVIRGRVVRGVNGDLNASVIK